MIGSILLLLSLIPPSNLKPTEHVDLVVYEHYYKDSKNYSYDELIFYDEITLPGGGKDFVVCHWLLVNNGQPNIEDLYLGKSSGSYLFTLTNNRRIIYIKAKYFKEVTTVGSQDLERKNLSIYPTEFRRKLKFLGMWNG